MSRITFSHPDVEFDHQLTTPPKPRAFRAHLYDQPGALVQVNGVIYFVADDGIITEFTIPMTPFCAVLGEIITSETQRLKDCVAGGPAQICVTREMGRSQGGTP